MACRYELPVIDAVASDYSQDITFLAVAGKSSPEKSAQRVDDWFDQDHLIWGYSDELWELYEVHFQPVSFLISSDGVVVEKFFGPVGDKKLRSALDRLLKIG